MIYHFVPQTPVEFLDMYKQKATKKKYIIQTGEAGPGFDAVWALATALNKTAAMVQSGNVSETGCEGRTEGDLVPLQHFNKSISFISSSQHLNVGEGACVHTVPSTLSVSTPLGPVQSSSYK